MSLEVQSLSIDYYYNLLSNHSCCNGIKEKASKCLARSPMILCDIDGTICEELNLYIEPLPPAMKARLPRFYNLDIDSDKEEVRSLISNAKTIDWMISLLKALAPDCSIQYMTGRSEKCLDETTIFLKKSLEPVGSKFVLRMRPETGNHVTDETKYLKSAWGEEIFNSSPIFPSVIIDNRVDILEYLCSKWQKSFHKSGFTIRDVMFLHIDEKKKILTDIS